MAAEASPCTPRAPAQPQRPEAALPAHAHTRGLRVRPGTSAPPSPSMAGRAPKTASRTHTGRAKRGVRPPVGTHRPGPRPRLWPPPDSGRRWPIDSPLGHQAATALPMPREPPNTAHTLSIWDAGAAGPGEEATKDDPSQRPRRFTQRSALKLSREPTALAAVLELVQAQKPRAPRLLVTLARRRHRARAPGGAPPANANVGRRDSTRAALHAGTCSLGAGGRAWGGAGREGLQARGRGCCPVESGLWASGLLTHWILDVMG